MADAPKKPTMNSRMALALEIALESIGFNDLITDRQTLLSCRLVSRAWRVSRTFSGKITAVTLHTLADIQMAAALFPSTPCQRLPWRSAEDSCIFTNLRTFYVPGYLTADLSKCSHSIDLLAAVRGCDIQVMDICGGSWQDNEMSTFRALANIGCTMRLAWGGNVDSLLSEAESKALTRLTRLQLKHDHSVNVGSLHTLSQLSSLRHLELPLQLLYEREDLEEYFHICASLSQLTRLEFTSGIGTDRDRKSLMRLVEHLAPEAWNAFQEELRSHCDRFDWTQLYASYACGVLNLQRFHSLVDLKYNDPVIRSEFLCQVLRGREYGSSFSHLGIKATEVERFHPGKLRMHFEYSNDDEVEQVFYIDFEGRKPIDSEGMAVASKQSNVDQRLSDTRVKTAVNSRNVQFVASECLGFDMCDTNDIMAVIAQLPTALPHLESFSFLSGHDVSLQQFLSCISELTRLTMLHLHFANPGTGSAACLPESNPLLPASLRELGIFSHNLKLLQTSNLEHLTKLAIHKGHGEETNAMVVLKRCKAPLRELWLQGFPLRGNLFTIAEAFPRLEVLQLQLHFYDVSSISSLQRLRRLLVALPDPSVMILTGVDTLTNLVSLTVRDAKEGVEGLRSLASLTQLRHLTYCNRMHHRLLGKTGHICVASVKTILRENKQKFQDEAEDLKPKMPHTRVNVEIELWE